MSGKILHRSDTPSQEETQDHCEGGGGDRVTLACGVEDEEEAKEN